MGAISGGIFRWRMDCWTGMSRLFTGANEAAFLEFPNRSDGVM
jgi:hypothetical protein